MKISKKMIDLIIYAHENGIDIQELEAASADSPVVSTPKKKKYSYQTKEKPTGASVSDGEIRKMKVFISVQKALGKLSGMQISAMKELSGTFAKKLSHGQREQLKNIYEDLKG